MDVTETQLKELAARAFAGQQVEGALKLWQQALKSHVPPGTLNTCTEAQKQEAAVLSSNIAAALLRLQRPEEALQYAVAATEVSCFIRPFCIQGSRLLCVALAYNHASTSHI